MTAPRVAGDDPLFVGDLSGKVIQVREPQRVDPALRQRLSLDPVAVNRILGFLHQIPLGRGLHDGHAAEHFPGYSFAELLRIIGLSGILIRDRRHHSGVRCNPALDRLIIDPDGSTDIIWSAAHRDDQAGCD